MRNIYQKIRKKKKKVFEFFNKLNRTEMLCLQDTHFQTQKKCGGRKKKHVINATQRWFLKQASQPLGCCMDVSHDLVLLFE